MKYKIDWLEVKHIDKLNKDVKEIDATDETGKKVKFTVWSDFPNFESITNAGEIEGNLWQKPNSDNFTLYPPKPATTGQIGGNKGGFIAKAQEKKAEFIEKAQDNKNESIKIASTFSSAVNCAIAEYNADTKQNLEELIRKWRKTLWFVWDEHTNFPPFL